VSWYYLSAYLRLAGYACIGRDFRWQEYPRPYPLHYPEINEGLEIKQKTSPNSRLVRKGEQESSI